MSQVTLGGDRLGVEGKMTVEMSGFPTAPANMRQIWQNTQSPGTLPVVLTEVLLPGDKGTLKFDARVDTLPTLGPLFSSFKLQIDTFIAPWRLYNSRMRGNMTGVGLTMNTVKLPTMSLLALPTADNIEDIDNSQINPSCLLKYLGLSGIGIAPTDSQLRTFNAVDLLIYWDIYERYYANQQEKRGAVVHCGDGTTTTKTITSIVLFSPDGNTGETIVPAPTVGDIAVMLPGYKIQVAYTGGTAPDPKQVYIKMQNAGLVTLFDLWGGAYMDTGSQLIGVYNSARWGADTPINWQYETGSLPRTVKPRVQFFPLSNIDDVRHEILSYNQTTPYSINSADLAPYKYLFESGTEGMPNTLCSQEGLGIKTHISDINNNWVDTTYMANVASASAVSTAGNSFTIDSFLLAEKLYQVLLRVAVSGGTVDDWMDATYGMKPEGKMEMPMFIGGMSEEVQFQAKYSMAATDGQPLATLAGTGGLGGNRKGGFVRINEVKEPSTLMVIASLTPRVVYTQGNKWSLNLSSVDDLFKPKLNGIGFEDLQTETLAWWDVKHNGSTWVKKSAGKRPAWQNYRTAVHKAFGNFAIPNNIMYMTLARRYEYDETTGIQDLTSYVDPNKFNFIFAEADLSAMNFWVQIECDLQLQRQVAARVMPNL
ncbi:MAG: major capsid protein [Microviridae sp.]|nr:MAG: major capsid protein [Microviridae sp.]